LLARLEKVHLTRGQTLIDRGDRPRYAYFPHGGMLSLLGGTVHGQMVELAQVGAEGMAGISIVLCGTFTPWRVMVQIPTSAWRIRAAALLIEIKRRGGLDDLLLRYACRLASQLSQSVVCHSFHTIRQRLSRW